ncbi:MAG: hypothetical protein FRX49_01618 [Trebouxia sp. A1-2]|nr:MAG: hypothetical protein FRX49_01618 [Trebouxia sp. A1-2]
MDLSNGKVQQLLRQIEQESGGVPIEALMQNGKMPELLRQIQQDCGDKPSTVPDGGQEVTPHAGFVVKTTDQDKRKVFINICGSDKIPEEAKTFLESADMSGAQQHVEALNLPLSLGETKHENDKQGEPCKVYDVVFNDEALKQAKAFRQFKVFIISLSMGWIQQQKKTTLDPKYKLPKMPYKGEHITKQIMRMKKKSLVTDMGDVVEDPEFPLLTKRRPITVPGPPKHINKVRPDSAQTATNSMQAQKNKEASSAKQADKEPAVATPSGLLELTSAVDYIGRPIEHILVTLDLPRASSSATLAEAVAEIAGNHLHIAMQGYKPLDVQLPFAVSAQRASASLSQDGRQLCLKLPYLPCKAFIQQLHKSKQQLVELADLSYDSYLELEP